MIRKALLLALVFFVLLTAGAPAVADGCNPAGGDACEMPDHARWRPVDVEYLPAVFYRRSAGEMEMTVTRGYKHD